MLGEKEGAGSDKGGEGGCLDSRSVPEVRKELVGRAGGGWDYRRVFGVRKEVVGRIEGYQE